MTESATKNLAGVILAGGQSTRMGQDKRFLELAGQTLLERVLTVFEPLFAEILIVVAEPALRLAGLRHRVVTDLIPGCASLGGVYTGLSSAGAARIFAAACDMPFMNRQVIEYLAGVDPAADVVIPRLATGLQPMHAVYSKKCLPVLERMARGGALKLQDIIQAETLAVRIIPEDELRPRDPQLLSFLNVNSPADLELARKLVR